MRTAGWYLNRIRAMSFSEILWRIRSLLRDLLDIPRAWLSGYPSVPRDDAPAPLADYEPGFSVFRPDFGDPETVSFLQGTAQPLDRLIAAADRLCAGRHSFLGLDDFKIDQPINWQMDWNSGRQHALRPSVLIDYRDFESGGDCKLVWELNRHHHLVTLARAHVASGSEEYADEIAAQLDSWLKSNPPGMGMNWKSPLELAIRLINWVWSIDLIKKSGSINDDLWCRIFNAAYRQCWDIARKYSQGSSANNHLIGEAAGVFVATSYFRSMPDAEQMREKSRSILEREILTQTFSDGCTKEHALGYQFFVMQFFLVAAIVADAAGRPMPSPYRDRLRQMHRFIAALAEGGEALPFFGDKDDGYVLDLGDDPHSVDACLSVGAAYFQDPELRDSARRAASSPAWLFPQQSFAGLLSARIDHNRPALSSRSFPESGYYLLQTGDKDSANGLSVLFDCAELGYKPLYAHGHADALSIMVRRAGHPLLVDTGTYTYFSDPELRDYYRSTRAHNTVEVDGKDQSSMSGPFLWRSVATATRDEWSSTTEYTRVSGSHDGYQRLESPVMAKRVLTLHHDTCRLEIDDTFRTSGRHTYRTYFHLHHDVVASQEDEHTFRLRVNNLDSFLRVDRRTFATVLTGSDTSPLGWVSPSYHTRHSSSVIVVEFFALANTGLSHTIEF